MLLTRFVLVRYDALLSFWCKICGSYKNSGDKRVPQTCVDDGNMCPLPHSKQFVNPARYGYKQIPGMSRLPFFAPNRRPNKWYVSDGKCAVVKTHKMLFVLRLLPKCLGRSLKIKYAVILPSKNQDESWLLLNRDPSGYWKNRGASQTFCGAPALGNAKCVRDFLPEDVRTPLQRHPQHGNWRSPVAAWVCYVNCPVQLW